MYLEALEAQHKDMNPVKPKTIILWGQDDLLSGTVESLMIARREWDVIRIYDEKNPDLLLWEVARVKPDVVIVYRVDDCPLLTMQLLEACRQIKLITFGLENNLLNVYSKKEVMVNEASGFLSAVET